MHIPATLVGLDMVRRSSDWKRWRELATGAPPYLAPEFFAITRPLAKGEHMLVAEAWEPGRIVGVLPLALTGDTLRALRSDHTPTFDYCGDPDGIEAIWSYLRDDERWNELVLDRVPADSELAARLPMVARRDGCPVTVRPDARRLYIRLPGFETAMTPALRGDVQRGAREAGDLVLERIQVPTRADLDEATAIEASSGKGAAGTAIAADPRVVHLYQALGRVLGRRGQASLYFLRAAGKRIATLFALEDRRTLFVLKIGYDPHHASCRPGDLLVWKVAADAEQRGLVELDFIDREDAWKHRWTDRAHEQVAIVVYRRSARGLFRYALREVIAPRVPPTVRETPRSPLPRRCQHADVIGRHTLSQEIRGRLDQGLGIKSGLRRALAKKAPPRDPRGSASRFAVGSWVRVLDHERLGATLDADHELRGVGFAPVQWDTCGRDYQVASHVRRIRAGKGRFRPIDGTVLLDGVDCGGHGPAPTGCGRHCRLMYRDEWLEPASAPPAHATAASTERAPVRHARIRTLDEIYAGLDVFGRRDGLTFMPQMAAYAGRWFPIANELATVFEYDRWARLTSPVYILGGLHCDGAITGARGPCDHACALMWHADWLMIDPDVDR